MSVHSPRSPKSPNPNRLSRQGFQPLPGNNGVEMSPNDVTIDIPLEPVVSHGSTGKRTGSHAPLTHVATVENEKAPPPPPPPGAKGRRLKHAITDDGTGRNDLENEEDYVNRLGRLYYTILNFSIVTRYFLYVAPLAICIAVPIIVGATVSQNAKIGGVRIVWFFTWVEVVWGSIWVAKIVAHGLPRAFQIVAGVVSSGVRKYALVIRNLELYLSLVGWAVTSLATFVPLMTHNPDIRAAKASGNKNADALKSWQKIVRQLLAAAVVASIVLLVEKFFVQLISINYHRKQFIGKIKENKRQVHLLGLLYDASRALFPSYCPEFEEEDYVIHDTLRLNLPKNFQGHARSGSQTPMRFLHDVGRVGDKITAAFGNIASEITGKNVFNPDSAHSIVIQALEKPRSSEALAKRLWMSFVVEGKNALYPEDVKEVLGASRETEAEEAFLALDADGNGDVNLEEMILMVTEIGRTRKSVATSMHDVDQAINVLDDMLCVVVFVAAVFIFIAFLNASFVTMLATAGTALLSLSFVFSATCQEVLGSCIFLFVKHPYDVGDRVDLTTGTDQLTVEHISLLFTVFKRVTNGRTVQIPNTVLNSLWIENTSRSQAMREQVPIYVSFDTSFEDITALKIEMQNFVRAPENNRDFHSDIDVTVNGIAELNKLELIIEIRHKSNWGNETLRAMRRSKFMCALVQALRKIPIAPPGGNDAVLGSSDRPQFSVAISSGEAEERRQAYLDDKESKRLFPSKKPEPPTERSSSIDYLSRASGAGAHSSMNAETQAINQLNARNAAYDTYRDDAFQERGEEASFTALPRSERASMNAQDVEDVRNTLRREGTLGKRKAGERGLQARATSLSRVPTINEPQSAVEAGATSGYQQSPYAYPSSTTAYNTTVAQSPPSYQYPPSTHSQHSQSPSLGPNPNPNPNRRSNNPYYASGARPSSTESPH
ncbi:Mechanosensitive ion channel-domain-containing protein [Phyllosticta citricarpa]|uniref:Mechanosensitive ion channel-domain-containing protein n=2 Tax=Phyllosticta TaxID=121621 RepID=A0ABR1MFF7_9PEZI